MATQQNISLDAYFNSAKMRNSKSSLKSLGSMSIASISMASSNVRRRKKGTGTGKRTTKSSPSHHGVPNLMHSFSETDFWEHKSSQQTARTFNNRTFIEISTNTSPTGVTENDQKRQNNYDQISEAARNLPSEASAAIIESQLQEIKEKMKMHGLVSNMAFLQISRDAVGKSLADVVNRGDAVAA